MENLVHLETMFEEFGKEDGYKNGKKEGLLEGKSLGSQKGFDIGFEVGFYQGSVELWLKIVSLSPEIFSERTIKALTSLHQLCASLPMQNASNVDPLEGLQKIRAKFRVVTSLLKSELRFEKQSQRGSLMSF